MGLKECLSGKGVRGLMTTLGIATSCAILVVAIFGLINITISLKSVIACVYQIFFGTLLLVAELRMAKVFRWFRFLVPFFGLGATYIFVAVFTIQQAKWYQILVAAVAGTIGVVNCLFFCFGIDRGIELNYQPSNTTAGGQPVPGAAASSNKDGHRAAPAAPTASAQPNPFENDNPFSSSTKAY